MWEKPFGLDVSLFPDDIWPQDIVATAERFLSDLDLEVAQTTATSNVERLSQENTPAILPGDGGEGCGEGVGVETAGPAQHPRVTADTGASTESPEVVPAQCPSSNLAQESNLFKNPCCTSSCQNLSKYRCPACRLTFCGLPHMADHECVDKFSATRYIPKHAMGIDDLRRDVGFLEDLYMRRYGWLIPERDWLTRRLEQSHGIRLLRFPTSHPRRLANRTNVSKQGVVYWTIEICCPSGCRGRATQEIRHSVRGTLLLRRFLRLSPHEVLTLRNGSVHTRYVSFRHTLDDALRNATILEMPSFMIKKLSMKDRQVLRKRAELRRAAESGQREPGCARGDGGSPGPSTGVRDVQSEEEQSSSTGSSTSDSRRQKLGDGATDQTSEASEPEEEGDTSDTSGDMSQSEGQSDIEDKDRRAQLGDKVEPEARDPRLRAAWCPAAGSRSGKESDLPSSDQAPQVCQNMKIPSPNEKSNGTDATWRGR